ncbi:hypothetical protein [Leptospira biflexa]|jgi:hypothetical protein|uniref:hypothetical protein n=1 Tax=Leptospira biflexa TaxID=172 RepID=UPI001F46E530|nr:hypothetical protein [Leptospira biflexa]
MPIANCYINDLTITSNQLETLTKEWAETIEVDLKDICLSIIDVSQQAGQNYKVMVILFLPSLWDKSNIERIQLSLDTLLKKHFKLGVSDVFIITNIVQSGNVTENGNIVKWE